MTPYEIQNSAARIHNEKSEMQSSESKFRNELEDLNSWWQGDASKAFAQGYFEERNEINRLFSGIGNLEDGLRRLATEVQRADDERRRKAEAERRSREQAAKSKK